MTQIALYVEGGGDTAQQKAELRQGFDGLLERAKSSARAKRLGWKLVCSGDRRAAYETFINAVRTNPDAINVLLVDSEDPIAPGSATIQASMHCTIRWTRSGRVAERSQPSRCLRCATRSAKSRPESRVSGAIGSSESTSNTLMASGFVRTALMNVSYAARRSPEH